MQQMNIYWSRLEQMPSYDGWQEDVHFLPALRHLHRPSHFDLDEHRQPAIPWPWPIEFFIANVRRGGASTSGTISAVIILWAVGSN